MKNKCRETAWDIWTYPEYKQEKERFLTLAKVNGLQFKPLIKPDGFALLVEGELYNSYQEYLVKHDGYIVPKTSSQRERKPVNHFEVEYVSKKRKKLKKQNKVSKKKRNYEQQIEEDLLNFKSYFENKLKSRLRKSLVASGIKRQKNQLDKAIISKSAWKSSYDTKIFKEFMERHGQVISSSDGTVVAVVSTKQFNHLSVVKFENENSLSENFGVLVKDHELSNALQYVGSQKLQNELAVKVHELKARGDSDELIRSQVSGIACLSGDFHIVLKEGELRIINLKISLWFREFEEYLEYNA